MTDFNNTGIFKNNTKLKQTQKINSQLKNLYTAWFEHMKDTGLNKIAEWNKLNGMHLLTCFDSYINKENKIMLYGQEANSKNGRIEVFDKNYQNDAYYKYDYLILNQDSNNTFFLKTRKIIAGLEKNEKPAYDKVLSILINNLNKTSFMGAHIPCFYNSKTYKGKKKIYQGQEEDNKTVIERIKQIDGIVYSDLAFNGITKNIFIHELNILRPTHLVFVCGKGYNNHIKRNFGDEFFEAVSTQINSLNVKNNPVSESIILYKENIKELLGLEDYEYINLIFAMHPSSHMRDNIRNRYNSLLRVFVETNNE